MTELSPVLIQLFKGPLYRDTHEPLWDPLLRMRAQIADYVGVLGLRVEVDESDGYAYLRSMPDDDDETEPLPRLVNRHKLPYHASLLLALLRKRLAEFDTNSAEGQLVLTTDQIIEMMRLYLPSTTDEVKMRREVEREINRVKDLGFLRQLRGADDKFEVRRIIRAFVDGQFLADLDRQLDAYLATFASRGGDA